MRTEYIGFGVIAFLLSVMLALLVEDEIRLSELQPKCDEVDGAVVRSKKGWVCVKPGSFK